MSINTNVFKNSQLTTFLKISGDPMVLLSAIYVSEYNGCTREFCDRHGLRYKAMQEIRKLRRQLANEMTTLKVVLDPKTQPPNNEEAFLLRQILLAGEFYFHIIFSLNFNMNKY